jgi:hypothetical protein
VGNDDMVAVQVDALGGVLDVIAEDARQVARGGRGDNEA